MKTIWKVRVHFQEDIEGELLDLWDDFNIEATDDVAARKKGIKCAKQENSKQIQVQYVEINHVLEFED